MREDIITLLSDKNTTSLNIKEIQKKLNIRNTKKLQETLNEMINDGTLYYSKSKEKYLLFEKSGLIKGEIIINRYGEGYIRYNGNKIIIPKDKINGAVHKDTVTVKCDEVWLQGEVEKIISHDNSNYVAEVILKDNKMYAKANKRPLLKINNNTLNLVEGHRILVQNNQSKAKVIELIGHKDDPGVDIQSILYDYGFGRKWSKKALLQLETIPNELDNETIEKQIKKLGRKDLRQKQIITMDCDDTKDIDDGYCIEKLDNGNILLNVVIADVDEYVKENSPIDLEARTDTTSVYPPNSVDPQLDHKLSNGICSLNPNTDRLALSYEIEIDEDGNAIKFTPSLAIINSKMKMSYSNVNKILEDNIMIDEYKPYNKALLLSQKLYLQLKNKMKKNNQIVFNSKETKVELDEYGLTKEINIRAQRTAESIIEYFMLFTNETITKFLDNNKINCVHRIDGEPNQNELKRIFLMAFQKGYISNKDLKNKYDAQDIQKLIDKVGNTRTGQVINKLLIRCMDKAKYKKENIGHYPLGFEHYSQNTSPIRRYPDLINQRIIKYTIINGISKARKKFSKIDLEEICKHCSEREIAAKKCERDATEMKIIEYMSNNIGKTYNAVISGINKDGIYILLDNTLESFIKKKDLPKDKYTYYENNYLLKGINTYYQLGDELEVKLIKADKDNRITKFELIGKDKKIEPIHNSKPLTRKRSKKYR